MGMQVCMGAMMQCSMGAAPSSLVPTPKTVMTSNVMAANIMDHVPMMNVMPFGMCQSPANPMVAAATAAALPRCPRGCLVRPRCCCAACRP